MKAEEIRSIGLSGHATQENRAVVEALEEIAAQLAQLNEVLAELTKGQPVRG